MAVNLFSLVGSIMVDNTAANNSIAKTDEKAGGLANTLGKGAKTIGKYATAVGGVATAIVGGVTAMANSAASTMDEIDKASQKMGISAQAYQEWDHVMQQNGMSIDSMKSGMKAFNNAMVGLSEEGDEANSVLADMGISLSNADGSLKSTEEVMQEAILALADMEEGAERTALATQLFGRAGTEMAPMLNAGAESITALKDEAHDLGLVFSDEAVKQGAALGDTMANIKNSFEAAKTSLAVSLLPIVQQFADKILEWMPNIQAMFERLAPIIEKLFTFALQILEKLFPIIEKLWPLIEIVLGFVMDLLDPLSDLLFTLLDPILALLSPLIEMLNILSPILSLISTLLKPILELINWILQPIIEFVNWIFGGISEGINGVTSALGGDGSGLLGILGGVAEFIMGGFSAAFDVLGSLFGGIIDFIKNPKEAIQNFFDWVNGTVGKIRDSLSSLVTGVGDLMDAKADEKKSEGLKGFTADLEARVKAGTIDVNDKAAVNALRRQYGVPELAQGAVLEPNHPFMAIVGDQKHGTNVEAPLATIQEAVRAELENISFNVMFEVNGDENAIFQAVKKRSWLEKKRTGQAQMA